MRYSIYNYMFESKKYGFLLYNSESNCFIHLSESLYNDLELVKNKKFNLNSFSDEIQQLFLKNKIIVEDKDNSFFLNRKLQYEVRRFNHNSLGLAIAPTTGCNFKCPYCYEENKKTICMSEKTEDSLVSYIKSYKNISNLGITWYGGEPLMGFKSIRNILNKFEKENILINTHSIISNGYLLDQEKSMFFADHPLNRIQITLDGPKVTHDKRRILLNDKPTYDKIISNIDTFFEYNKNTDVAIRVNLDDTNKDLYYDLYTELHKRWENKRFSIYPAFVRDYQSSCSSNCNLMDRNKRIDFYFELYKKYGSNIHFFPSHKIGGCGATSLNYYVVGPEGELYKCWNDIGLKDRIVGFLNENTIPNPQVLCRYLVGPTIFDDSDCLKCNLFPVCDGGCQWMRNVNYYENGQYDLCTNRKSRLNEFLELHYEQKLSLTKND